MCYERERSIMFVNINLLWHIYREVEMCRVYSYII